MQREIASDNIRLIKIVENIYYNSVSIAERDS